MRVTDSYARLPDLSSLRRSILSAEKGVRPRGGRLNVGLVYPNSYAVAATSLAFHRLWELTSRVPEAGVRRYFLENDGRSLLSLDGDPGGREQHVLAFFLSYELDYFNAATALRLLGVPLESGKRRGFPIVIGGGIAVTENPEPAATMFDALFVGEAEQSYPAFLGLFFDHSDRDEILAAADAIEGIYLPAARSFQFAENGAVAAFSGARVTRAEYGGFKNDFSKSLFTTDKGEFGRSFLIELSRGCPARCAFCISRTLYGSARFADIGMVNEIIDRSGENRFGLMGAAVSYHPSIGNIMEHILSRGAGFSISSLRAELIDATLIGLLKRGGVRTITIAPEAGSQRMRDALCKGVTGEHIERAVSCALDAGMDTLKLYFMVGLPGERQEDVDAICDTADMIRSIERARGRRFGKVSVTLSPFVPKPWTPFQWAPFAGVREIGERIAGIRKKLTARGVRVSYDPPRRALAETVLSRGDRRLYGYIAGCDGTKGEKDDGRSHAVCERASSETFPWDVVNAGIDKERLLGQWLKFKRSATGGV